MLSLSPCSVTVAASDCDDFFAFFSNHGKCVDIIAPVSQLLLFNCIVVYTLYNNMVSILVQQGVDILSTAPGGGTAVLSGRKTHPHASADTHVWTYMW